MTLDQLRIFIAVAERQHLTGGAKAAHLSPSAATAAIQALEGRHGTKLFHRVARRLELSSAGVAFLPEAKAVLAATARAEAALQDLSGLKRGRLTIAASQTLASHWLPPILVRFAAAHAGIDLNLREGNTATVSAAVLAGDAELGCIEGEIDEPALAALSLAADRLVIVAAPSHPLARETAVPMARLAMQRWVMRERGSGTRGILEGAVAAAGIDPDSLPIVMTFPTNEAVCAAAAEGACLTAVSELVAAPYLQAGRLRRIDHALPQRRFILLRHKERYLSQAAIAFEDLLRREAEALAQRQRLADFEI